MRRRSSDAWFDEELEKLKAGLEALEASLGPRPAQPEPRRKAAPSARRRQPSAKSRRAAAAKAADGPGTSPPAKAAHDGGQPGVPGAMATATIAEVRPQPASGLAAPAPSGLAAARLPPAASTPAAPVRPTGTSLREPKQFGLEPPTAELERGAASAEEYRQRLVRHINFATQVLHTSGVQAAVWREWRAFEKLAHERLRELSSRPAEVGAE